MTVKRAMEKMASVALSVLLAAGCCLPSPAFAEEGMLFSGQLVDLLEEPDSASVGEVDGSAEYSEAVMSNQAKGVETSNMQLTAQEAGESNEVGITFHVKYPDGRAEEFVEHFRLRGNWIDGPFPSRACDGWYMTTWYEDEECTKFDDAPSPTKKSISDSGKRDFYLGTGPSCAGWNRVYSIITFNLGYDPASSSILLTQTYRGLPGNPVLKSDLVNAAGEGGGDDDDALLTAFPSVGTRAGYEFLGWVNTSERGRYLQDSDLVSVYPYPLEGETSAVLVYEAVWQLVEEETPTNDKPVDLYELLTEPDGNTRVAKTKRVQLTSQGSYYLSRSVEGFTGNLLINKAGVYDIDLRGNTISFGNEDATSVSTGQSLRIGGTKSGDNGNGSKVLVNIKNEEGEGGLVFCNGGEIYLASDASLEMTGVAVSGRYTASDKVSSPSLHPLIQVAGSGSGIGRNQSVILKHCTLVNDMSSVTSGGLTPGISSATNTVITVDASSEHLKSLTLDHCTVEAKAGMPARGDSASQQNLDAIAVAVSSTNPAAQVTIDGGTLSAQAQQGSAIALYNHGKQGATDSDQAASVRLSGDGLSLRAEGGGTGTTFAIGFLNATGAFGRADYALTAKPALLDARVRFEGSGARYSFALASDGAPRSASSAPFVVGPNFGGERLPAYIGGLFESTDTSRARSYPVKPIGVVKAANGSGRYIASFADGVGVPAREAAAGAFVNGAAVPRTSVALADDGIRFESGSQEGEASIWRDGEPVVYELFEDAVSDLADGEEIVLNHDLTRAVQFARTDSEKAAANPSALSFAVDLAGHSMKRFTLTSRAQVRLHSSEPDGAAALIGATGPASSYPSAALVNAGTGALVVDGVPVVVDNAASGAYGAVVAGGGSLALKGAASVSVSASSGDARGVWVESGSFAMVPDDGASPSVSVSHSGSSGAAVGVDCAAVKGLALDHASVSVAGAGESLVDVSVTSATELAASGCAFRASADEGVGHAGCVELADAVKAAFNGCAFNLELDGENTEGECIGASAAGDRSPSVALAGVSTFVAPETGPAVHVRHEGAPLAIGDGFALSAAGASRIAVASSGLTNKGKLDVFAEPASEDGDIAGKTSLFSAADSSEYAGYAAEAIDGGIAWCASGVASVEGQGAFTSLARALAAAPAGGTVEVLRDFSSGPVAVPKEVTIDLKGHEVQVKGSATAAIMVSAGALTVKDSGRGADAGETKKGLLSMRLSASGESDQLSAASGNRGIVVAGSGSLVIDGAAVSAVYEGVGHAGALCAVYAGVAGKDVPSVQVMNGASVEASSSRAGSLTGGAFEAYGIYDGASDEGKAVSVDAGSSVSASSMLAPVARGSVVGDAGSTTGLSADTNPLNGASIRRLVADEDSELYREVCERFLVDAKYDRSAAQSGMGSSSDVGVYGAHVYWAAPMKLANGMYAWAFSKPVADELAGKASAMVPAAVYVQSTYEVPFDAVGIGGDADAKGSVSVNGSVSARSAAGNAYGLRMRGGEAAFNVAGASVRAQAGGTGKYLENTGEPPDLKAAVGIDGDVQMGETHNFYPSGSKVSEVVEVPPEAVAIAGDAVDSEKAALMLDGRVSLDAGGGRATGVSAGLFAVGEAFSSDAAVTVSGSGGVAVEKGSKFAVASGDGVITMAQRDSFADASGKLYPVLSADGKNMAWGDAYNLTFLDYYGAPVSVVEGVLDGQEVSLPDAPRSETSTTEYVLAGWSVDPNASPDDDGVVPAGERFTFVAADLPHEVTFHAVYEAVAKAATVTFEGAKDADGSALGAVSVEARSGEAIGEALASLAPAAKDYGQWRFVGWRATVSGNEPITNGTKGQVERVIDPMALHRYGTVADSTLSAYYVYVGAGQQLASFKVDDYVYAYAVNVGDVPVAGEAMATIMSNSASVERGPERLVPGESWTFSGWFEGASDSRDLIAAFGPDESLPIVMPDEDAFYTAAFGAGEPIISTITLHYYNDWGSETGSDWRYNERSVVGGKDSYQVLYGTDMNAWDGVKPVSYAENGEQGWRAHRFLGWSVRSTDKEPLGELLPKVGDGYSNYYAIYSDEPMAVTVRLDLGDGSSALVEAPASATVGDLPGLEGYCAPTAPAGKVFAEGSWTDDPAEGALSGITRMQDLASFTAPVDGDGRYSGTAVLYPVFDDAPRVRVSMHGGTDAWEDRSFEVTQGGRIDTQGYSAPYKLGFAFVGWNTQEDGSGNSFDLAADAVEGASLELWARYEPIEPAADESGASVDVGGAYVNKAVAVGADSSGASIAEARTYDRAIAPDTAAYEVVQSYRVELDVARRGEKAYVESGFGTMSVVLPVPEAYAGREIAVYVANSSGSSDFVACKVQGGTGEGMGTQSASQRAILDVSDYGASSQGNIVVVAKLTSLDLAKRSALQQMQAYLDSLREEDYEAADYDLLVKDFEQGARNVRAATTADEVKAAAQAAVNAMASYPSKAGLAEAKASALEQLASAYSTYNRNDYTDENWAELERAYAAAKEAVLGATTKAAAAQAASDGAIAMSEIEVKSGGASAGPAAAAQADGDAPAGGQDGADVATSGSGGGSKAKAGGKSAGAKQAAASGLSDASGLSSGLSDTSGLSSGLSLSDTAGGLSSGGGLSALASSAGAAGAVPSALADTSGEASGTRATASGGDDAAGDGDDGGGADDAGGADASPAGIALRAALGCAIAAAAGSLGWWFWRRRPMLLDDDEDFWGDEAVADGAF